MGNGHSRILIRGSHGPLLLASVMLLYQFDSAQSKLTHTVLVFMYGDYANSVMRPKYSLMRPSIQLLSRAITIQNVLSDIANAFVFIIIRLRLCVCSLLQCRIPEELLVALRSSHAAIVGTESTC